jgi:hypothetical protein
MRYWPIYILLLAFCIGCDKQNFLRYSNSPRGLTVLPDLPAAGVQFFSFEGDTIRLKTKASASRYVEVSNENPGIGGNDPIELVQLERTTQTIGSDTPYYRFSYTLSAIQDISEGRGSRDELVVSWLDSINTKDSQVSLNISDTIVCSDANCEFSESLSFGNGVEYSNLYFTPRSAGTLTRIFINENQGLVAFTLSNGQTYQRIL